MCVHVYVRDDIHIGCRFGILGKLEWATECGQEPRFLFKSQPHHFSSFAVLGKQVLWPQFPPLKNGHNEHICLTELLHELQESTHVKPIINVSGCYGCCPVLCVCRLQLVFVSPCGLRQQRPVWAGMASGPCCSQNQRPVPGQSWYGTLCLVV